ncbi:MAG: diaminopimelate decarboxylase [Peptoniphilaceae bacterium]|nr:diaminopimelate decarboxylase [Peptoniphilaceae bacterium]MDY6018811.1 diaminopimelate decarboxylase [Anaerococcus sp.]
MLFDPELIKSQAQIDDSFYLYSQKEINKRIDQLQKYFPEIEFIYSMKCNSNPFVTKSIFNRSLGADAASAGEVRLASYLGLKKDKIYYSAPGKSNKDIERSIKDATIIADSLGEIEKIDRICKDLGIIENIGLRINPDFSFYSKEKTSSKFGIDQDQVLDFLHNNKYSHIRISGIHVHLHSQELDPDWLINYYKNVLNLAEKIAKEIKKELDFVNMGSGIGIDYSIDDRPIDLEYLAKESNKLIKKFRDKYKNTKIIIETGRFLVGKAGLYVSKVIDKKVSNGKTYVILKNTLNGFIRPAIEEFVSTLSADKKVKAWEPLFTGKGSFQYKVINKTKEKERVNLVGNLCTATDMIAEDIEIERLEPGDLLLINNAGAYAAVLTPMQFASLEKPVEYLLSEDNQLLN